MNLAQAGEILKAVRQHPEIGRATCSYIDETMTDLEVLEEVKEAGITTAEQAVAHLVIVEKMLRTHEEEMTANWRNS
jgi:hypothetical protein